MAKRNYHTALAIQQSELRNFHLAREGSIRLLPFSTLVRPHGRIFGHIEIASAILPAVPSDVRPLLPEIRASEAIIPALSAVEGAVISCGLIAFSFSPKVSPLVPTQRQTHNNRPMAWITPPRIRHGEPNLFVWRNGFGSPLKEDAVTIHPTEKEVWLNAICNLSGCAKFAGLMQGPESQFALFTSTITHSTLALPILEMSVSNIQRHVQANAALFQKEIA